MKAPSQLARRLSVSANYIVYLGNSISWVCSACVARFCAFGCPVAIANRTDTCKLSSLSRAKQFVSSDSDIALMSDTADTMASTPRL